MFTPKFNNHDNEVDDIGNCNNSFKMLGIVVNTK